MLGVSFVGHEAEAMRLFSAIEASWRGSDPGGKQLQVVGHQGKGARELRNLQCTINYDRRRPEGGRSGLTSHCCHAVENLDLECAWP